MAYDKHLQPCSYRRLKRQSRGNVSTCGGRTIQLSATVDQITRTADCYTVEDTAPKPAADRRQIARAWVAAHLIEIALFAAVLFSGAYFYNGASWNQSARYDVIFCFVEPGPDQYTFRINSLVPDPEQNINTGDWAMNPDHHPAAIYSNKAPGTMLLGIAVYFPMYYLQRALGVTPESHAWSIINCYLLNLVISVLPLAVAAVCFYRICLRLLDGNRRWSVVLCATLFCGTLALPYSTLLWGHTPAMAWVVIAMAGFLRGDKRGLFGGGLAGGIAVLTEYPAAVPVLVFTVAVMLKRDWRGLLYFLAGGLGPLIVFAVYHQICFGSPLVMASSYSQSDFIDADAAGGLFNFASAWPAAYGITFSPYRGLFWHMPVLLITLALSPVLWKKHKLIAGICLANIALMFILNLSFNGWHGGACVGPRYQIPVLPFYVLLGVGIQGLSGRPKQVAVTLLTAAILVSVANMVVITIVSPFAREYSKGMNPKWRNPLVTYYQGFFQYRVTHMLGTKRIRIEPVARDDLILPPTFNWGEIAGLDGRRSLLPWLAVMGGLSALVIRKLRQPPPAISETTAESDSTEQ